MATPVDNNTPGTPSPTPEKLTPEAVIEQIRTLRSQIGDVTPLSKAQRRQLKQRARKQPAPVVDASISVIGSSDMVAQAVGQPLPDVLQLQSVSVRWNLVADEIRSFLKGIEGANLVRREQLAFIASGLLVRVAARAEPGQRRPGATGGGDQAPEGSHAPQEGGAGSSNASSDTGSGSRPRNVHRTESVKK